MIYLDTSVLVPWFVAETTSTRACAWRDSMPAAEQRDLVVSAWAVAEFTNAMGLKVRARELTRSEADEVLAQFHEAVLPHLVPIEPAATDFRLAETSRRRLSHWGAGRGDLMGMKARMGVPSILLGIASESDRWLKSMVA